MIDDLAEIAAYPIRGVAMAGAFAYGVTRLCFARVESVHACLATGIGLQRAGVATGKLGLFELASIAREQEAGRGR